MSINFITIKKKNICLKKIGIVSIFLADEKFIKLLNIAFVLECNSNLIFLKQLCEMDIIFPNSLSHMTLIKHGVVIT